MSEPPGGIPQDLKPDHGTNFVPGSEEAPDHMAPQPLDHFKRGYKERAHLRDRETNQSTAAQETRLPPPADSTTVNSAKPLHTDSQQQQQPPHHRESNPMQRRHTGNESRSSYRGAASFDAIRLVDNLCRPGCNLVEALDEANTTFSASFQSGKALTAILSNLARRRKMGIALSVWQWMDQRKIEKNVFHYNSLISVCEKMKDNQMALRLLEEMERQGIQKNEVTFSSAISACEKAGQWRVALDLLERMKREGVGRTAIAYNAAISACEKGLVPHKALELFEQMKREGVTPTVITYSALISAAEKGQQWKLALEVLEEMKASGHGANVIAYSAAISALSKGQMWEKALELFREIESSGNNPSIVTYNATMTALEKGLQWERALDLFDEMKAKHLPITVVSYGSAISACEKGLQYRQCLEYLDEMAELGIKKNVIIFGAAMSCMEKCCRADIAFQLMDRMKTEGVAPNVHIYNSAISACARSGLWQRGFELFEEMEKVGVVRDVVSFNAVLDAVSSQVRLGRRLFELGIEKGFYSRVSRLGTQWLELDLHFLSLGGGEIALGWWFEECLVPYLVNTSKLAAVKSIDIVTGYGKTRMRGVRHGDDGMRKRVRAMLEFMKIQEVEQSNKGRIHIDKEALMREVQKNGGKILFDEKGYRLFKEENTTANHIPDVAQNVRPRYRPPESLRAQEIHGDRRRPSSRRDGVDRRGSYNARRGSGYSRGGSSDNLGSQDDRAGSARQRGSFVGNDETIYNHRGSWENKKQTGRESTDQARRGSYENHDRTMGGSDENTGSARRGSYEHRHSQTHDKGNHHAEHSSRATVDYSGRREMSERMTREGNRNAPARRHFTRDGRSFSARETSSYGPDGNHHGRYTNDTEYPDESHYAGSNRSGDQKRGSHDSHSRREPKSDPVLDYSVSNDRRGSQVRGHYSNDRRGSHTNEQNGSDRRSSQQTPSQFGNDERRYNHSNDRNNDSFPDRRSSQSNEYSNSQDRRRSSHHGANRNTRETGEYRGRDNGVATDSQTSTNHDYERQGSADMGDQRRSSLAGEKRPYQDGGDGPSSKRRGYEIDSSRSSFTGKRGL